jgi:hypothetical protein
MAFYVFIGGAIGEGREVSPVFEKFDLFSLILEENRS